jgi:hypothetical protein
VKETEKKQEEIPEKGKKEIYEGLGVQVLKYGGNRREEDV